MSRGIETLKAARSAEMEVRGLMEELERLHRVMQFPCSSGEKAAELSEKLAKIEKHLNIAIDSAVDRKREALSLLSRLKDDEREVLFRHYILCHNWVKISMDLFISERQVYNIRKTALAKLENYRMGNNGTEHQGRTLWE